MGSYYRGVAAVFVLGIAGLFPTTTRRERIRVASVLASARENASAIGHKWSPRHEQEMQKACNQLVSLFIDLWISDLLTTPTMHHLSEG